MTRAKSRARRSDKDLVRPTAVDRHVGGRVRQRRVMLGMTQVNLASQLGVTFQQLQKNERGTNRIASSRLFDLSVSLDVPIQFFFDEMPANISAAVGVKRGIHVNAPPKDDATAMERTETLRLVRAYYQIEDGRVRRRVYDLAKALAEGK